MLTLLCVFLIKAITTTVLNSILWSINSFSIDGYHEVMDSVRLSDLMWTSRFFRWKTMELLEECPADSAKYQSFACEKKVGVWNNMR